jgi:DNA-binding NtrC family response regulator
MSERVEAAEVEKQASSVAKARILVVDDEVQVVNIFQDLLTQQGYLVESCDNGDDAILKVTTGKFDLVLTDINLPGVDGLEVIRAAKAADKDTCVILITGYASTTTAIDALRQGAYDYITKPFDLWETAKAIERGLESRLLTTENRRLIAQLGEANSELQQHEEILRRKVERATHRLATPAQVQVKHPLPSHNPLTRNRFQQLQLNLVMRGPDVLHRT